MPYKVLHNLRLFDGVRPCLQADRIVVVRDGVIRSVEDAGARPRYRDGEQVDLQGLTLLPGLIDSHVQIGIPFIRRANLRAILDFPRQLHNNLLWVLHSGVTTVRDMAGIPGVIRSCAER
jgi:imidazolonepropionase-like amidohydrolase